MKIVCSILTILLLATLLIGCGKEENPVSTGSPTQLCVVWLFLYDYPPDTLVGGEGVIIADEIPAFQYVKLGDSTFSGEDYYDLREGDIWLSMPSVKTHFEPISVEVKTSLGPVRGSCNYPEEVSSVNLSASNLQIGDSLVISWSANSDFAYVDAYCEWYDSMSVYHYRSLDTMLTDSSVVFSFPFIRGGGRVYVGGVGSANGPFPKPGAKANMGGSGAGFLYYNGIYQSIQQFISIGSGFPSPKPDNSAEYSAGTLRRKMRKMIMRRLNLE